MYLVNECIWWASVFGGRVYLVSECIWWVSVFGE